MSSYLDAICHINIRDAYEQSESENNNNKNNSESVQSEKNMIFDFDSFAFFFLVGKLLDFTLAMDFISVFYLTELYDRTNDIL